MRVRFAFLLALIACSAEPPVVREQVLTAPTAATWTNLNPTINFVADEQGVVPGSWPWLLGGVAAFSGQTGAHSSYGWRHHWKVAQQGLPYVRSVIANYGHRRVYYDGAVLRGFGYYMGGRPRPGWVPEQPGDLADGRATYLTPTGLVYVSGPEVEHFWLDPLWALVDSPGYQVQVFGAPFPADGLARILATLQVRSLLGQIRATPSSVFPWGYGDRGNARILDTITQASLRGCIQGSDVPAANEFIDTVLLPFYEKAPGIGLKPSNRPGKVRVMTFNGMAWLLPIFYDAWRLDRGSPRKARLWAIIQRWSQWYLDLETVVPGRAFNMAAFYAPGAETFYTAPAPVASLAGLVTEEDCEYDGLTWEHWGYRACAVAAAVTRSPVLENARDVLAKRHLAKHPEWIVDKDRQPVRITP